MSMGPDFSALANVFPKAQSIVCFIHPQATYDAVAAAVTLGLIAKDLAKNVTIFCEEPMRVEYNYLFGIDKISQKIGNKDLVLQFPYQENQVDKVSYNIDEENKIFELVVAPQSGVAPLSAADIRFSHSGINADLIFLFGYHSFSEMGEVYEKEGHIIERAYSVAFTQNQVSNFAKLHLALRSDNFSYSELVYFMIRQLQVGEVKDDLATNLLSGIEYATEKLTLPNLPARVFETIAALMRNGAVRQPDNPAYDHLGTPIKRLPEQNYQPQPAFNSAPDESLDQNYQQAPSLNAQGQVNWQPVSAAQSVQFQPQVQSGPTSHPNSSDLAKVMQQSSAARS